MIFLLPDWEELKEVKYRGIIAMCGGHFPEEESLGL